MRWSARVLQPDEMDRCSVRRFLASVALAALGCVPGAVSAQEAGSPGTPAPAIAALERSLMESIARAERSVVAISRQPRPGTSPRGGVAGERDDARDADRIGLVPERSPEDPDFVPQDYATGVIVDRGGLIVTAYHALGDVARSRYWVTWQRKPYEATVRAADPWLDLAVLKIAADNLEPIKFGDARDLRRGRFVVALGNPFAIARDGHPSATWGIISNLSRRAPPAGGADDRRAAAPGETLHHYGTLIQTDARLHLGTSGGALVNLQGEMIGLTTTLAALEGYETAAGFAIPVDDVFLRTLETLKAGRKAEYGFLGVAPELLTLEERQAGGTGVRVLRAVPGTPAAKAGLLPDDLITHVAGVPIVDSTDLIRELSKWPVEAKVNLTVQRGVAARGVTPKPLTVQVELAKKHLASSRPSLATVPDSTWRGLRVDYATAVPRFESKSREMDPQGCVLIADVDRDSPAWKAGLRPGGFISHVGTQRVGKPREFYSLVASLTGDVALRLSLSDAKSEVRRVTP